MAQKRSQNRIAFWLHNLSKNNGLKMKIKPEITKVVYSDTSSFAYGGYVVEKLGEIIPKTTSSTYRELLAIKNILNSLSLTF